MDLNIGTAGKALKVSPVAAGTWAAGGWMWGGSNTQESIRAIQAGIDNGMTSIDTAPVYGQGLSEEIVGAAIRPYNRADVQLLTKFGMRWDTQQGELAMHSHKNDGTPVDIYRYAGRESVRYECEQSLKRLGTDYIDLFQIHWPDVTTPIEETFEEVALLIKEGKIRYAGVCNYNAAQLQRAMSVCEIVSNQVPYSMLNRKIEAELVPFCISHNVGILAYSPMERGLLTGKIKPGTVFKEDDHRSRHKLFQPEIITEVQAFLDSIAPMAESKQISLSQLVLAWTKSRPGIAAVLAGIRTVEQAISNARAMQVVLEHEEIMFIEKQLGKLTLPA